VLDGDPPPPQKGTTPYFRRMSDAATVAHLSYCWARVWRDPHLTQSCLGEA